MEPVRTAFQPPATSYFCMARFLTACTALAMTHGPRLFSAFSGIALAVYVAAQCGPISIGPDVTICQGTTTSFTLPAGFPNYLWSTGATTPTLTTGFAGTYWGQVSYPSGNIVTNGNFSGGNTGFYGDFTYDPNLQAEGNYYIGTNANTYHPQWICTGSGNFLMVNAGWMHAFWSFWCQGMPVCPNQTYTLSFRMANLANTGPPTVEWLADWTTSIGPFTASSVQGQWNTYTCTLTTGPSQTWLDLCLRFLSNWGVGNDVGIDDISVSSTIVLRDSAVVNVTPLPVVNLGPDKTFCAGEDTLLNASVPGGTYLWQDGSTSGFYNVTGPGTYSVTVTANNCSNSDAVNIAYTPLPIVALGNDTTVCPGEPVPLDATLPGGSYVWQDGSTAATFIATTPGVYDVDVTVSGCTSNDAITVANYTPPVVTLGADISACVGDVVTLSATIPGASYLWSTSATANNINVNTAGTYWLEASTNGCPARDSIDVFFNALPVVDLGNDTTVCPGEPVPLDATTAGGSYVWQDGSTASTFTANGAGMYDVDVTVNGCTSNDAITVANFSPSVVALGADISACAGDVVPLGASIPGASYLWSTGATTNNITVTTTGTYWLEASLNGCPVRDSIDVTFTPLPIVSLSGPASLCPGATTTLDATLAGATYLWSTGSTSSSITVGAGSYTVDVTVSGCTSTDAITIGAFAPPIVSLGNDTTLCPGGLLPLDATTPGASYLWSNGNTGPAIVVAGGGNWFVDVTDVNGCTGTDSILVTYTTTTPVFLGPDALICDGMPFTLDATTAGATYLWSTGETTPTIDVSAAGTFSVVVDEGLCSVSDAIIITTTPAPVVDLGNDTTLCPGAFLPLDATTPGVTYLWSNGTTGTSIIVAGAGTWYVDITDGIGCVGTDSIHVFYATPTSINLGNDTTICQGQSITLDATLPGSSYLWSTGATTAAIVASTSGPYSVQVTQGACSVNDAMNLTVTPLPAFDLGNDTTICAGASIPLDATVPGGSYAWSTGSTSGIINVNSAATYSVTVTANGCPASDAITVSVLSPGAIDLGNDTTFCAGGSVLLDATLPGATYAWSTGATTPMISASTTGSYSVTASVSGCTASDAIDVVVTPLPVVDLGNDTTICAGTSVVLDATTSGASYLWSTGSTASSITVNSAATYSVDVTVNNCTATDALTVAVLSPGAVDLGADTTFCAGGAVLLDATLPGATYAWSTGATTPTISASATDTYSVTVDVSGCTAGDAIDVVVTPLPTVDLGNDTTICAGASLSIDATTTGATYLWSTGSTASNISVNTAATYSVDVTVNGCAASDAITVGVLSPGAINLGADTSFCSGGAVLLDATLPGATYLWSTGATSSTLSVSIGGPYSVTATVSGCTATDAINVTVLPIPSVDLGNDTTLCDGATIALDAVQAGATYLWQDGSTASTFNVTQAGPYSVVVDLAGCTASDAITVSYLAPDFVDLGPDQSICPGNSVLLNAAVPGASYLWQDGNTASSESANTSGLYWVQVSISGCTESDSLMLTITPIPQPDLGPDDALCAGDTALLTVAPGTAGIVWSDGSTGSTLAATSTNTYTVTLTLDDCTTTDAIDLTFFPFISTLDLGADRDICQGEQLTIDAYTPGAEYDWSTGQHGSSITVDEAGWYSVAITGECIDAQDSLLVIAGDCPPIINVPNGFTPDGDGMNEVFLPVITGEVEEYDLFVFDRWGEAIFSTHDAHTGWDGRVNGIESQEGVYVWTIRFKAFTDGGVDQQRLTGHVTLLR